MIESGRAIQLAAARPEIESDRAHAALRQLVVHIDRITAPRRSLQAVHQQYDRCIVARTGYVIEVHEIAIRQLDPFAPERRLRETTQIAPRNGLRVCTRQPARWAERPNVELPIHAH